MPDAPCVEHCGLILGCKLFRGRTKHSDSYGGVKWGDVGLAETQWHWHWMPSQCLQGRNPLSAWGLEGSWSTHDETNGMVSDAKHMGGELDRGRKGTHGPRGPIGKKPELWIDVDSASMCRLAAWLNLVFFSFRLVYYHWSPYKKGLYLIY